MTTFTGTPFDDSFSGSTSADTFNLQQGGNDTATGNDGDDLFVLDAALNADDQLDGGSGNDTLSLNGDYSGGLTFTATTVVNIETINLAAGNSYRLTTNEATVASGATLSVDGSALGAGDSLVFDGIAERDGSFTLTGGAGDDVLQGGDHEPNLGPAVADIFNLQHGGNDQVTGGYNATNTVNFGPTFTAADRVLGSSGAFGTMTVVLVGDYTGVNAVVFGADTIVNVDAIKLGGDFSYDLTTADANLGHGNRMTIDASALAAGNVLTFDGAAETSGGSFLIYAGAGNDVIQGGASDDYFGLSRGGADNVSGHGGSDTFYLGGTLTGTDQIHGGSGDDTVELNGDYSGGVTFGGSTLVSIESLVLDAGHSYVLSTADSNVASGKSLQADASGLGSGNVLVFDGAAETNGSFTLLGGAGDDLLIGGAQTDFFIPGAGNDTIHGGGGDDDIDFGDSNFTLNDYVDGGAGFDAVRIGNGFGGPVTFAAATFNSVEYISLSLHQSYDITTADDLVAAGESLLVHMTTGPTSHALKFDGSAETNGRLVIEGGDGNDHIRTGAKGDYLSGGGGADFLRGGGDHDIYIYDYGQVSDSTGPNYDTVYGFDATMDKFEFAPIAVSGVNGKVTTGTLSKSTFDTDLHAALAGHLGKYHAVLFTPDAGTLSGDTFLVVDENGVAGYQSGHDYVIRLQHGVHLDQLSVSDFRN